MNELYVKVQTKLSIYKVVNSLYFMHVLGIVSKPGSCPPPSLTPCSGLLNDGCFADVECPGEQKCCDGNCGNTVCRDPVSGEKTFSEQ